MIITNPQNEVRLSSGGAFTFCAEEEGDTAIWCKDSEDVEAMLWLSEQEAKELIGMLTRRINAYHNIGEW